MRYHRAVLALLLGAVAHAQSTEPAAVPEAAQTPIANRPVRDVLAASVPADVPYQPLTPRERWDFYLRRTYLSPLAYTRALASGVVTQLDNRPTEWGQGVRGYSKRTASAFGVLTLTDTYEAAGAAALGHEVRYVRCRCTGVARRTGYALSSSLFTRNRDGGFVPAVARIGGAFGAEYTARSWLPQGYQSDSRIARDVLIQTGARSLTNTLREFTPELKRLFRRK